MPFLLSQFESVWHPPGSWWNMMEPGQAAELLGLRTPFCMVACRGRPSRMVRIDVRGVFLATIMGSFGFNALVCLGTLCNTLVIPWTKNCALMFADYFARAEGGFLWLDRLACFSNVTGENLLRQKCYWLPGQRSYDCYAVRPDCWWFLCSRRSLRCSDCPKPWFRGAVCMCAAFLPIWLRV